jgi:hypothetical protein
VQNGDEPSLTAMLLLVAACVFVIVLLAGGLLFTFREFNRLGGDSAREYHRPSPAETPDAARTLVDA